MRTYQQWNEAAATDTGRAIASSSKCCRGGEEGENGGVDVKNISFDYSESLMLVKAHCFG